MVTPICPLCTGVSQINAPMAQTLSQNQTLYGYVTYNWSYGHFCDFLAYFGQNLVAMATPLRPYYRNVFFGLADHENPLLLVMTFSLSLVEIHLYAFIAILVPKFVAMVTPLCSLCTGVSQINAPMAQTLSQNQTLYGDVAYNWSYGQFCDFWPILAKIWLPWQRPLDPCNQKCLLWIGRPRKPPVVSNHILAISHRNAFICIL